MYLFISSLYMFRASQCSSSGDRIVLIRHLVWLVCVSDCLVCRFLLTGIPSSHLHLGIAILCHKNLHESCKIGRRIDADSLICSLGHCECDGHTVHKLSQRRLTADWLAPQESDCSRMNSKVSSDRLQSYIKATRPVLEIFKTAGYFPGRPRMQLPTLYRPHHPRVAVFPTDQTSGGCSLC